MEENSTQCALWDGREPDCERHTQDKLDSLLGPQKARDCLQARQRGFTQDLRVDRRAEKIMATVEIGTKNR